MTVAAEASDGSEAIRLIREHKPDVAVLDIQILGWSGIDVIRQVRSERLPVGVLILTAFDDLSDAKALLRVWRRLCRRSIGTRQAIARKLMAQLTELQVTSPNAIAHLL